MKCIICDQEFIARTGAKFCSPKCRKKHSRIGIPSIPIPPITVDVESFNGAIGVQGVEEVIKKVDKSSLLYSNIF